MSDEKKSEPTPSQDSQEVREVVHRLLRSYRCQHTKDEDGDGASLLDVLSPGETVAKGLAEIELLADEIAETVALPQSPKGGAAGRSEITCLHGRLGIGDCAVCTADNYPTEGAPPPETGSGEAGGGPATPAAPPVAARLKVGDWVRVLPVVRELYVLDLTYSNDGAPDIVEDMAYMVGALYQVDAVDGDLATVNKWAFRLEWLERYVPDSAQPTAERSDAAPSPDLISQIHSLCVQSNAREGNPLATSILAAIEAGASGAGGAGLECWVNHYPAKDGDPWGGAHETEAEAEKHRLDLAGSRTVRMREVVEAPRGEATNKTNSQEKE